MNSEVGIYKRVMALQTAAAILELSQIDNANINKPIDFAIQGISLPEFFAKLREASGAAIPTTINGEHKGRISATFKKYPPVEILWNMMAHLGLQVAFRGGQLVVGSPVSEKQP